MEINWREVRSSAQELHYRSENDRDLYIHDSHEGALRKSDERYNLVYAGDGYSSVLKASDDLHDLENLIDDLLVQAEKA